MTAVAERATVDGFAIVKIGRDDPAILQRLAAFVRRYNLPITTIPLGHDWFGLVKDDVLSLVVGVIKRHDGALEITDFYPAPTRDGVRAAYLAGEFLKSRVDSGSMPYFIGAVLPQNGWMDRHYRKFFGAGPKFFVYCYEGK